jgi:hypothetical protein
MFAGTRTALAATALMLAGAAGAQGLGTSWNLAGDVLAQAGVMSLTTAYFAAGSDPDAPFNLSGHDAIGIDLLETTVGVAAYALDVGDEAAFEGSAAGRSFAVAAGEVLHFDWSFATLETDFQDHAFAVLDGQLVTLAMRGNAVAGWQSFSHSFTQAGTATLWFGVADTGDYLGVSTLNITNVQLSAVPQPPTLLLMLAGLGTLAGLRRRQGR